MIKTIKYIESSSHQAPALISSASAWRQQSQLSFYGNKNEINV
jgi:hypothetical protein